MQYIIDTWYLILDCWDFTMNTYQLVSFHSSCHGLSCHDEKNLLVSRRLYVFILFYFWKWKQQREQWCHRTRRNSKLRFATEQILFRAKEAFFILFVPRCQITAKRKPFESCWKLDMKKRFKLFFDQIKAYTTFSRENIPWKMTKWWLREHKTFTKHVQNPSEKSQNLSDIGLTFRFIRNKLEPPC